MNQPKTITNRYNWTWRCFGVSVLFFPLFPALGALGLVIVLGIIWYKNHQLILHSDLNRSFAILASLLVLSAALAEYPSEAWLGLANFLPYFALFMALRCLITDLSQLRQLAWILVLPSLAIVLLGWGQLFLAWDTPSLLETIFGWHLVPLGVPAGRMSSVFNYTNVLAIYLAIAFTLTLGLWLETWQQKSSKFKNSTLCLLALILLADISGLILTSSRNAWGLAVFSFMAYAVYLGWKWLVWGITGAAMAILWAAFVPNFGGTQLRRLVPAFIWLRLSDEAYQRPVETLRFTQWQFCWQLITERPVFGWGLRNFTPLYEAKMNLWLGHPHNLFLMFGAETGIISLLLFLAIIAMIMFKAAKLCLTSVGNSPNLIFFSYLIAFTSCVLFNLADVTIFDLRINTMIWILLAAISGVTTSALAKPKINY
ncbi:MAG: O-antigen ligase family protein [Waterburya sp.]